MTDFPHAHRMHAALSCAARTFLTVGIACSTIASVRAESRLAHSWIVSLEGCLAYLETGKRNVFTDWYIAFPSGGVCNGDPACESRQMTFIPMGQAGTGAVTVDVTEPMVGDQPETVTCALASGTQHRTSDVAETTEDWLNEALIGNRIVQSNQVKSYLGCAYDGRSYRLSFGLSDEFYPHFESELPTDDVRICGGLSS